MTKDAAIREEGMLLMQELALETDSDDRFHKACGSDSAEPLASEEDDEAAPQDQVVMVKYVDDTTIIEAVDKESTVRHIMSGFPQEVVATPLSNALMLGIVDRTEEIGMRVNC